MTGLRLRDAGGGDLPGAELRAPRQRALCGGRPGSAGALWGCGGPLAEGASTHTPPKDLGLPLHGLQRGPLNQKPRGILVFIDQGGSWGGVGGLARFRAPLPSQVLVRDKAGEAA